MSGQNRSHAVMAQRAEAQDSLDDFPTQPWGVRALVEYVLTPAFLPLGSVWEPACNRGFMARALAEYFKRVITSDVCDYGWSGQQRVEDFLFPTTVAGEPVEWIITNPPFRLAEDFIAKALKIARVGCAMLVRTSFLEGVGRYERLYSANPPTMTAQFVERLPMVKGRVDPKASTATSYIWLVWAHGVERKPLQFIPPCRARLERAGDYHQAK